MVAGWPAALVPVPASMPTWSAPSSNPFYRHRLHQEGRWQVGHRDHQEPLPGSSRQEPHRARRRELFARSRRSSRPARHHPLRHARGLQGESQLRARRRGPRNPGARHHALPQLAVQRQQVGHVDRHEQLYRLQRLHRRPAMPRTTFPSSASSRCASAATCSGSASTPTSKAILLPPRSLPAHDLPALRKRAVRTGLPGRRHRAHAGRPQHDGLQPLRGHSLLLQQLPLQGAPLQLPALLRLRNREPQADAQSRCLGSFARRHGEVQLLRAAHQRGQDRSRQGKPRRSATAKSSPPASRHARPRSSPSATSTTRTARWRS